MGDLLKEAIADAKAVRETALANAKMALEEAFTPQLKSMLSAKLKEDEMGDEEDIDTDEEEEEISMHEKMYRMATARYNPFSIGGSENCHSDIDCPTGGSEAAWKVPPRPEEEIYDDFNDPFGGR